MDTLIIVVPWCASYLCLSLSLSLSLSDSLSVSLPSSFSPSHFVSLTLSLSLSLTLPFVPHIYFSRIHMNHHTSVKRICRTKWDVPQIPRRLPTRRLRSLQLGHIRWSARPWRRGRGRPTTVCVCSHRNIEIYVLLMISGIENIVEYL